METKAFTTEQQTIIKNLSAEEKKVFEGLKHEDQLAYIVRIEMKNDSFDSVEFAEIEDTLENVTLLAPKSPSNPLGLVAGDVVVGRLLGYVNMFSEDEKENWTKVIDRESGKLFYANGYYKFQRKDGSLVGLRSGSNLWRLGKIATVATNPLTIKENPVVKVTYLGLIEGKERLKAEFGIEIQSGNSSHVYKIEPAKNAVISKEKGIINYLNSPVPVVYGNDGRSDAEIAMDNYTKQAIANEKAKALMLEQSQATAQ